MERTERPVGCLQQFRFQFRTVFFQIQNRAWRQSHFIIAVRQHDRFAATRLGDEFAKLTLGIPDGNRFHVGTLILGTKSCKRLPEPILAADEDFAQSALKSGLAYPQLIERVIRTGLKTVRE